MNTLQIVSIAVSMICVIITTVLAWIMLNKRTQTEVSFTGVPVDKSEFDKAQAEHGATHAQIFSRIGGSERGLEQRISARIDKVEGNTDRIWEKMESDKVEILKTDEDRTGKLHDRINEVLEGVAELRGQIHPKLK